jgi:4'-phosphopantetheinyl transferase EntD
MLDNKSWLEDILSIKADVKKQEKLAVRVLLKGLLGEEKQICYYDTGRPYLEDSSYYISISHTKGYVAIALDRANKVGIDIEQFSDKVRRVRSKFISDREYIDPQQELLHLLLHWSAKESIYKILDISGIELKEDAIIQKFIPQKGGVFQMVYIRKEQLLNVEYIVEPEFVLTYISEKVG